MPGGPGAKKFPELKLMINGEFKNGNNSLSSDDDMSLAFPPIKKVVQGKDQSAFNYQQQLQNMSHYSVGAHPSKMQLSYYGAYNPT